MDSLTDTGLFVVLFWFGVLIVSAIIALILERIRKHKSM